MSELRINPQTNIVLVDKSLATKAADLIRERIISGEYPMGSRLLESEFSKAMQISRASVREAFMILENNGLLERHTNKATLVVDFGEKDAADIYHLRAAIEVACLERCIRDQQLDTRLLSDQARVVQQSFLERGETPLRKSIRWIHADLDFHQMLISCADNPYAGKVWQTLKYQTLLLLHYGVQQDPATIVPLGDDGSHETLLQLIVERNSAAACSFLKRHILTGGRRVQELLAARERAAE